MYNTCGAHSVICFVLYSPSLSELQCSSNFPAGKFLNSPKPTKKIAISNMAQIINGKAIAQEVRTQLAHELKEMEAAGYPKPHLTAVIVGEDPASEKYVANKMVACREVGISSETKRLPASTTQEELLQLIADLNKDPQVTGILVQLPVPEHINERTICNAVDVDKDVDGFNEVNIGRTALDMEANIPATPLGVKRLLEHMKIETLGRNAVVVGRSKNVSLPMAILLHADGKYATKAMDATVTICHRYTPPKELARHCRQADIIVVAVGKPGLITKDMVKPGACVIDVGINRIKDESTGQFKLVGDVDFEEVRQVAGHITPVPGGVGPMTVAMLMHNTLKAARKQFDDRKSS